MLKRKIVFIFTLIKIMKINQFSIWDKMFVQFKMELTKAGKNVKSRYKLEK